MKKIFTLFLTFISFQLIFAAQKPSEDVISASKVGDVKLVQKLIDDGADINIKDEYGDTPLMIAIKNRHEDIAGMLLEKGADAGSHNLLGETPLLLACEKGLINLVKILKTTRPDEESTLGYTPLLKAAASGYTDIVALLVKSGIDVNQKNKKQGQTALMKAAFFGHPDVVSYLIEHGAAIDEKARNGYTALIFAAQAGYSDVAQLLLEKKADVNMVNILKENALMLALDFDHVELARYLIEQGINVQAMDIHKNTALIRAASRGLTDIVQLLIDHKADVNTQTDKGWSALMLSAKNDYRPTADLLLQNGADLKAKNDNGETAKSFYHKFTLVDSLGYDTPPEPVNGMASIQDELNIPRSASKLGIEGKVVVRAQIDQDGVAVDTQIKESIKNDACDQAAMEAVRAVDWKPAKLKGKAVTAWFDVPVQITTQKKQAKSQPQRPNRPTPAGRDENE